MVREKLGAALRFSRGNCDWCVAPARPHTPSV